MEELFKRVIFGNTVKPGLYESQGTAENIRITQTFVQLRLSLFGPCKKAFGRFFQLFSHTQHIFTKLTSIAKDFQRKMKTEKMCVFEIIYLKGKNNGQLIANLNEHNYKKNTLLWSNQIQ